MTCLRRPDEYASYVPEREARVRRQIKVADVKTNEDRMIMAMRESLGVQLVGFLIEPIRSTPRMVSPIGNVQRLSFSRTLALDPYGDLLAMLHAGELL